MSLTSCYEFVVELSEGTMTSLLSSVIAQGETAGIPVTYTDTREVDGFTATVTAQLVDSDERPSAVDLTDTDLEVVLHLHMDLSVQLEELPGLDPISYQIEFQLPGTIEKDESSSPAMLQMVFSGLTSEDLQVDSSGGGIVFTASLFEPLIHQFFLDHPAYNDARSAWYRTEPGVDILGETYFVEVYFYDDDPSDPESRGTLWVDVVDSNTIAVNLPGRMRALDVGGEAAYDATFVARIEIDIVEQTSVSGDTEMVAKLDEVTESDVSIEDIVFSVGGLPGASTALATMMKARILDELSSATNPREDVPSQESVQNAIEQGLLMYSEGLTIPLLPLEEPTGSEELLDLSTAVPTTIESSVLALQIEQIEGGPPCDTVDNFLQGAEFAVAVAAPRINELLNNIEESIEGGETEFEGYDVTMGRPNATLSDAGDHGVDVGHIWVTGSVVVHVGGCVGDVDATYEGSLTLVPINRSDGTLDFDVVAGEFTGDSEAKDKKEDFDPSKIRDLVGEMEFPFPNVPTQFEGVGEININYTSAVISSAGIVLTGGTSISLLNAAMISGIWGTSLSWTMDSARER